MNAAKSAVLSVFPGAVVSVSRIDSYPITVTIEANVPDEDDTVTVWSGSQKDLFSKYGHRAVPKIKAALEKLKE